VLILWHRLSLLGDGPGYTFNDMAYVHASADGGTTWTQLAAFYRTNNTTTWSQVQLSLATYTGKKVKVRFSLAEDGDGRQADGWYIDDVEIREAN
jgi:hypothetical protein